MDRLEETDEGYYEQVGDVREWRWKKGKEPGSYGFVETLAVEPEPKKVVTTATAAPVVKPKAAPKAVKKAATKKAKK